MPILLAENCNHPNNQWPGFGLPSFLHGVLLKYASKPLGHKSVTTTEGHYAKWVNRRQDRLNKLVIGTWD